MDKGDGPGGAIGDTLAARLFSVPAKKRLYCKGQELTRKKLCPGVRIGLAYPCPDTPLGRLPNPCGQ